MGNDSMWVQVIRTHIQADVPQCGCGLVSSVLSRKPTPPVYPATHIPTVSSPRDAEDKFSFNYHMAFLFLLGSLSFLPSPDFSFRILSRGSG